MPFIGPVETNTCTKIKSGYMQEKKKERKYEKKRKSINDTVRLIALHLRRKMDSQLVQVVFCCFGSIQARRGSLGALTHGQ